MFRMHFTHTEDKMRILAGLIMTAAIGVTGAVAQPGRLTDAAYMQTARCAGLASSANLGSGDGATLIGLLKSQSLGRDPYVLDKATTLQHEAKHQADHADGYTKSKLEAELGGMCATLRS